MTRPAHALRPLQAADLPMLLAWRNHISVRRYMLTQHEISAAEHQSWFARAAADPDRQLLLFTVDEEALGYLHFTQAHAGGVADWGFYTAPEAPKGTGRALGVAGLDHAFCRIGVHKVCAQALAYNQPSIGFHRMLGFRQEGLQREQHFDGTSYHDLIHFGLLRSEWMSPPED